MASIKDHLIIALDVPTLEEAKPIVDELVEHVGAFKVGLELLTAEGAPAVLGMLASAGARVMYDGKFHDIGNTMAGATRALARRTGVAMFTVHASAGPEGMAEAAKEKGDMKMLAVTVLTSFSKEICAHVYSASPNVVVTRFVVDAIRHGADGIVCSPLELDAVRAADIEGRLKKVVPGIRPASASTDDQSRSTTPSVAIMAGATHLVVGRPVLRPFLPGDSRRDAAMRILDEVDLALASVASR